MMLSGNRGVWSVFISVWWPDDDQSRGQPPITMTSKVQPGDPILLETSQIPTLTAHSKPPSRFMNLEHDVVGSHGNVAVGASSHMSMNSRKRSIAAYSCRGSDRDGVFDTTLDTQEQAQLRPLVLRMRSAVVPVAAALAGVVSALVAGSDTVEVTSVRVAAGLCSLLTASALLFLLDESGMLSGRRASTVALTQWLCAVSERALFSVLPLVHTFHACIRARLKKPWATSAPVLPARARGTLRLYSATLFSMCRA